MRDDTPILYLKVVVVPNVDRLTLSNFVRFRSPLRGIAMFWRYRAFLIAYVIVSEYFKSRKDKLDYFVVLAPLKTF